jgi:hypothetical protein
MTRLLVIPTSSGGWDVKDAKGTRLSHHDDCHEAEQAALELLARLDRDGEVIMHGRPTASHAARAA